MKLTQADQVPPNPQKPGLWWRTAAAAFVSCPNCAMSILVYPDADGDAHLVCPYAFCGFKAIAVTLDGWGKPRKVKLSICATAYEPYAVHDADTGEFVGYANHRQQLVCGTRMLEDELDTPQPLDVVELDDDSWD